MIEFNTRGFLGSLFITACFIIGCMFVYRAVEYWVSNTFDNGRYEISKIQSSGGGDSWSFWKIDRRMGNIEYCSLDPQTGGRKPDFTCIPAKREAAPAGAPAR
ncbi:MAG: hypothetical protein SFX19_05890 [Alphaproteobacteria bacterium]|nr:hypothetical protein [Alphaproteobacteria bacterium]